ncbi:hypothetical protein [Algoriphagus hitonicola]|uniref:6-bladed beta-propeller protein n=1 Tax=Algoriphagus hitonicola TaxID=435880 RepID=A0A1I2UDX5_9BACT|nr:hypothetical protein [Algoriphagus hitonicola]SFG75354.1 hypothetical protein SAMN04487988_107197 [Algoriphagus hitonicola]
MKNSLLLALIFLGGCSSEDKKRELVIKNVEVDLKITDFEELEKFEFEFDDQFVGKGFFEIENDQILFFDRLAMRVLSFDSEGNYLRTLIDNGEGPSEIPRFQTHISDGTYRYFMDGYTILTFDQKNELRNRTVLDFYHQSDLSNVEQNPSPEDPGVYEVKYWGNQLEIIDGYLYTKIESSNPKFNFVMHPEYYTDSYLYAKVDPENGKVLELKGKHPKIYQNYKFLPHFDYYYHDRVGDELYLSFEPDSLIYILDKDFEVKEAFGNSGQEMDQSYVEVSTVEDWEDYWRINRAQKGFYKYVKFFPEEDVLFRTYTLGNSDPLAYEYGDNPQRMQIYKNKQLIGDVEVPNFFKVIGKLGKYYIADGSADNPDNEELVLYRFKLDIR